MPYAGPAGRCSLDSRSAARRGLPERLRAPDRGFAGILRALQPIRLNWVIGRILGTESHRITVNAGIPPSECRNQPTTTFTQPRTASA